MSSTTSAAELRSETIAAWDRHIAGVERSWHERPFEQPVASPEGRSIAVPGGSIHEWRGSVVIRDMRVGALVDALQTPGLPPPADDILDARVLQHAGNTLRVYIKLTRTALVTVTYDTEHVVSFERLSPSVATSRSISTTIRETGGSDRGFVWRLNSYWTYRQAGDDVVVSLLSESLSRDVPLFARPVAGPIVDRIGRDSIRRALDAIERFGNGVRNNHLAAGF